MRGKWKFAHMKGTFALKSVSPSMPITLCICSGKWVRKKTRKFESMNMIMNATVIINDFEWTCCAIIKLTTKVNKSGGDEFSPLFIFTENPARYKSTNLCHHHTASPWCSQAVFRHTSAHPGLPLTASRSQRRRRTIQRRATEQKMTSGTNQTFEDAMEMGISHGLAMCLWQRTRSYYRREQDRYLDSDWNSCWGSDFNMSWGSDLNRR